MKTNLLAARIPPWPAFKLRKLAEMNGQNLGIVLAQAVQAYVNDQAIPQAILDVWLAEYRAQNGGDGDAPVD